SALQVTQEPSEMQVTAGDRVVLQCQVEVAEPWDLLRVDWVQDGAHGVLCTNRWNHSTLTPPPCCTSDLCTAWHPDGATLSLLRVREDHAGHYLCKVTVEIPHLVMATSNGTTLSVTPAATVTP
ncbi:PREDICTED: transmembrane and immunoglobulin domain-containing protein 2, partial [Acanthisitta chloris]|uniref:transmembrane and immunoglobulin domain-containing protein 2 n=1 Tax=Acanthisitta chloris TaxID=57068 RepID=UPI0004F0CA6A